MDPVDFGLARLRQAKLDRDLDGVETAILGRFEQNGIDVFRGRGFQVQLAVSCGALLIGLAVAQAMGGSQPSVRSETVVLSDDSRLAPSISLEGGA